jgi:hypothetical protein
MQIQKFQLTLLTKTNDIGDRFKMHTANIQLRTRL